MEGVGVWCWTGIGINVWQGGAWRGMCVGRRGSEDMCIGECHAGRKGQGS
jgi:hypothetical protein